MRIAETPAARRRALLALIAVTLFGPAWLASCGRCSREESDVAGAWWAGRSGAVREILAQLAQLEGTPLARRARELSEALPDCESVGVHAPEGAIAALAEPARCLDAGDPLEQARRRADADLVFALPIPGGGPPSPACGSLRVGRLWGRPPCSSGDPLIGELRVSAGALGLDLRWPEPPSSGLLGLLVPGDEPAGPDRLAYAGRMVHLRIKPRGGIDLPSLVRAGSQADRLFRLRNELFASAALDGTWEAAVYLPERAGGMPGVALALGVRMRSAATAAAERFVADVQRTWPVRRSDFRLAAGDGACLLDLNVLPDLAPCYVATTDALVVGWNAASLERALARAMMAAPDAAGRLDVNLALIHRADDLLARHFAGSNPPLVWPWSRVLASGDLHRGELAVRLTLLVAPKAAS